MARRHRNPSFPTGLVVGAVLGAGALAWWLMRKPAASATQALTSQNYLTGEEINAIVAREEARLGRRISREESNALLIATGRPQAPLIEPNREYLADADPNRPTLSYHGDTQGRVLTLAEIEAINNDPSQPLLPAERAMLLQQRAALAAQQGRID